MSSLSFDSHFSAEARNHSGEALQGSSIAQAKGTPDQRHPHLRLAALSARTQTEASPWVLSLTRRCIDFSVAFAALLLLAPLLLLAAVLVRLSSRGPVFFRQRRMGRHGREFTLYKFRSMTPVSGRGASITVAGDTRITPVGSFLRRFKLDEIPQFWNVLRGDMCLVGPRPKLPHHEALHMDCRPGITGVATLAFRREEEFLAGIPAHELEAFYELFIKPAKAQLDLDYMRTASLSSDLGVLGRTVASCIFGADESLAAPAEIIAQHAATRNRPSKSGPMSVVPRSGVRENPVSAVGLSSEM
ncbi:MAG TPA: sugar transferase [Acidobacteriaceae bacterium]|nr:sugar transferase [Acidobacteriaceae bacterium]